MTAAVSIGHTRSKAIFTRIVRVAASFGRLDVVGFTSPPTIEAQSTRWPDSRTRKEKEQKGSTSDTDARQDLSVAAVTATAAAATTTLPA